MRESTWACLVLAIVAWRACFQVFGPGKDGQSAIRHTLSALWPRRDEG